MDKKLVDNKVFKYTDNFDNIRVDFDVETGIYEFKFKENVPFKNILQSLIPLSEYILENPPILERAKEVAKSEPTIDLNNINANDLAQLITALAAKLNLGDNLPAQLIIPAPEPIKEGNAIEPKSKLTQDVIVNFESLFTKNITFEELAEARMTIQKYINNTEYEELLDIKDDLENDRYIVNQNNTKIIFTFLDIVDNYIGYIKAVKAVNPNLSVDVWGRAVTTGEMKTVTVNGELRQVPLELAGVKTETIEPEFRRNPMFEASINKKVKW